LRRQTLVLCVVVLAAATLLGGIESKRLAAVSDNGTPRLNEYAELVTAAGDWSAEKTAPDKLVYASIRGMLNRLDPHTNFLDPDEFSSMEEKQRGSFYGLGISIQKRQGRITVISPIEGTPAWKMGIRAGDVITHINGEAIDDWTSDEVVRHLKGPKGTKVSITIRRAGLSEPIQMTITRAEIPTNSVRYAFLIGPDVGYIHLAEFTHTSDHELLGAIENLEKQGMKKLLLDLRGNPGGVLDQAVDIADIFLAKKEKVVYTRGRTPSSAQDFYAPGNGPHFGGPLVLLVNRGSASASEIVAGAIQDHDRGLIVGTTTWGKGLVQSVYPLPYGAGLALTTAKYYTPSGRWIQRDYSNFYDYINPEDEGPENREADKKQGKVFYTDAGRTVYAAGGITPDEVVKYEKSSKFLQRLQAHGVFFNFAIDYLARHRDLARDFAVTDSVKAELFEFLQGQGLGSAAASRADYEKDPSRDLIDASLKTEILNSRFGLAEGWKYALRSDKQAHEALNGFTEAERIAHLPKKPRPIEEATPTQKTSLR
jgi:carboxyl-terminal processing protease